MKSMLFTVCVAFAAATASASPTRARKPHHAAASRPHRAGGDDGCTYGDWKCDDQTISQCTYNTPGSYALSWVWHSKCQDGEVCTISNGYVGCIPGSGSYDDKYTPPPPPITVDSIIQAANPTAEDEGQLYTNAKGQQTVVSVISDLLQSNGGLTDSTAFCKTLHQNMFDNIEYPSVHVEKAAAQISYISQFEISQTNQKRDYRHRANKKSHFKKLSSSSDSYSYGKKLTNYTAVSYSYTPSGFEFTGYKEHTPNLYWAAEQQDNTIDFLFFLEREKYKNVYFVTYFTEETVTIGVAHVCDDGSKEKVGSVTLQISVDSSSSKYSRRQLLAGFQASTLQGWTFPQPTSRIGTTVVTTQNGKIAGNPFH
ncbi:hypothetical protein BC830DRAFT_1119789 [Chytriomyces sp. MP71]|nr:hypothetical protein BC830DRAFT_1119789 [Chytriomyces sp. MP71]